MHEEVVRRHINQCVTGSPHVWPLDWYRGFLAGRRFDNAISLGCGEGALERDALSKDLCASIVGLDISASALDQARALASSAGLGAVTYAQADLNSLELSPATFDAAFFHQSLHHVERLDSCLATVARALRPGALLYLDEYVGPSRRQWSRRLLHDADLLFTQLPATVRRSRHLRLPVDWRDPTEAINSSQILDAVGRHFRVLEQRDYGGNLLSVIYPHLRLAHLTDPQRDDLLLQIIAAERELLAAGQPTFYTVLVATPFAAELGGRSHSSPRGSSQESTTTPAPHQLRGT